MHFIEENKLNIDWIVTTEVVCQVENEMKWEAGTADVSPLQMKGEKKSWKFSKCL